MYQQFTHYWNVARFVVVVTVFAILGICSLFSFGGFAPSLDVANSYEFNQVHQEAHDKDLKDAHDRVMDDRANDRDSSESDLQKDADYQKDHAA